MPDSPRSRTGKHLAGGEQFGHTARGAGRSPSASKRRTPAGAQDSSFLQQIIDSSVQGLWCLESRGTTTFINPAGARFFGGSPGTLVGLPLAEFLLPGDVTTGTEKLLKPDGSPPEEGELRVRRRDGSACWVHYLAAPSKDASGRHTGSLIAFRGVPEHAATEMLPEADDYRAVFEHIPHPVWLQDFSGIKHAFDELRSAGITDMQAYLSDHPGESRRLASLIRLINMNRASLLHFRVSSRGELSSQTPLLATEQSYRTFSDELVVLFNGGATYQAEIEVPSPEGGQGIVALNLAVMPHAADTLARVIITFTDITQQRRAEEEIRDIARFPEENPSPVLRILKDGTLSYANTAAAPLLESLQLQRGQTVSADLLSLVGAALGERSTKLIDITSHGKIYSILIVPVQDRGHVNLYGRDVTLQVKMGESLRRKEEGYRTMVAHAEEPMVLLDREGKIVCVSPRLAQALRYTPEEMEGMYAPKLVDSADVVSLVQKFQELQAKAPLPMADAFRLERRGGGYIWVTATAIMVNAGEENQKYLIKCEPLEVPVSGWR